MGWVIYGGAIWFTKFVTRSWSTFYLWIINVKLTFVGLSTQDTFNFAANVGSKVVPIAIQYLDENDGWVDKDLFITFSSKWGNNKPK